MSFFIRDSGAGKVKSKAVKNAAKKRKTDVSSAVKNKRRARGKAEEISSDDEVKSDEEVAVSQPVIDRQESEQEGEEEETAQEKRLRLAKLYLEQLATEEASKIDADTVDRDTLSRRLKEEALDQAGKLQKRVADDYLSPLVESFRILRGHKLSVTCLIISHDNKHIFSGSKDCSIIKWNAESGRKECTIPGNVGKNADEGRAGHTSHVLALAASSDGKFLVSGGKDKMIHVWDPLTCKFVHTLRGHKDAVSGLAFRKGTHQLFSCSFDRSVKIWNLDEMAYVETLFGHQDNITSIDSLTRERAVTSGGRDGSVRIWKVIEESQLLFHGHTGSIDCVRLINEEHFVSCSDDGTIALWGVLKKKPLNLCKDAHGRHSNSDNSTLSESNWICAVASLPSTDLIASGSKDGYVRLWKCGEGFKSMELLHQVPLAGFINSLQFASNGSFLVAGVGQEHKLGRWWSLKEAKNCVCIIPLQRSSQS